MNSAEIRPDGKQMGNPNGEERPGPNILRRSWACFTYHFLLSLRHIHQAVKDDGLTQLKFGQEGGYWGNHDLKDRRWWPLREGKSGMKITSGNKMGGSVVEYHINYVKVSYICLCCIF